jgi:hypothetical protein
MNFPGVLEVLPNGPVFVHRANADGTIVSFCRRCFMTVASSQWEADLERGESSHKCDPIELEFLDNVLHQKSKSDRQEGY